MKVLICEDEEVMLTALEFRLRRIGYQVIKAADGRIALDQFHAHTPDIVIANLQMPFISGLELLKHIRLELRNATPVIIFTALEEEDAILESMRHGANDFIAKPFRPMELILRIRTALQQVMPSPQWEEVIATPKREIIS
jgi:DNA-binding response OmpR family regulator